MTPEAFRQAGHELIDWIADYRQSLEGRRVLADVGPGDVRRALPTEPPTAPEPFDQVLADLEAVVLPGVTNVQHPMHFGWFPSNAALASVLGDLASSGIGGLGISWESCPSLTEVEEVTCDWMRQLVGLSSAWSGTIQDTASTAVVVALLAARERATDFGGSRGGLQAEQVPLTVYATGQAHSSVLKAAAIAGYGVDNLRVVPVDPVRRSMLPGALAEMIAADVDAGRRPAAVVASVGTTGTTAFDPLAEIATVLAAAAGSGPPVWLHVDAAMAGSAMICPEFRGLWDGVEAADSLSFNPHKWLGTILDCSLFYVRDPQHLVRVFSSDPSYLQSSADGQVTQFRDWGIPLGRRFRALKLWFHLRLDGVESMQQRVRRDVANAAWLAEKVGATAGWEVVAPVQLQTVCVRHVPAGVTGEALEAHTLAWATELNRSGAAYVTPSKLDDRWMVRVSVGVESTERSHVARLWELMQDATRRAEDAGSFL